jgi:putative ATPase
VAAGETYWPADLEPPVFYEPRPRGLELRIGERLAELKRINAPARAAARKSSDS